MEAGNILQVNKVYKKYNNDYILRGINLSLPKGSTYGLLGPSGCGKTTLLRCILGQLDIDSGIIRLALKTHSEVGFMPQGISLHGGLTVMECMKFYGLLAGITGKQLERRVEELASLLDLPTLTSVAESCSGGQQRRVSLAVTLLHNPELLILDEPTVGLDPLLAHRIWIYLKDLSVKQNTTILVTTHYMEEARSLNIIGLMRGGVLLAEKPPMELLEEYNCESLDDVFLEVIKKKQTSSIDMEVETIELPKDQIKSTPVMTRSKNFDCNHVKAQVYKNYKWMLRSILVTFVILALPFVVQLLVGFMFLQEDIGKDLAFYNEESLYFNCSDMEAVRLEDCKTSNPYSCMFLEIMDEKHRLRRVDSVEDGLERIKQGSAYGLIFIPNNFTTSIVNRMSFRMREMELTIDDETPVKLWLDNTYYHLSYQVKLDSYLTLKQLFVNKCIDCGIDPRLPTTTMTYQPKIVYGENSSLTSLVFPPLTTGFALYMAYVYTTATVLMDISSGALERVQVNGMTTAEMLTGDSLVHLGMTIIQNILTLFCVHVVLNEAYYGSIVLMYVMLIICQISGSLVGMFVLTFDINSFGTNYIGMAIATSLALSSGMVWPVQGMHWILRPLALYSPLNLMARSYGHVMQHGFSLFDPHVYKELFGYLAYVFLFLFLIVIRVKYYHSRI